MKFIQSLPDDIKDKVTFKVSAEVLHNFKFAILAAVLLSSVTVYNGMSIYLTEYIENYNVVFRFVVKVFAFVILALAFDMMNVGMFRFIIRSILHKVFLDTGGKVLKSLFVIGVISLTYYSYSLSQLSASLSAYDAAPTIIEKDLSEIDKEKRKSIEIINSNYNIEYEKISKEHDVLISNSNNLYATLINSDQTRIDNLEKTRKKTNTFYVDKLQKPFRDSKKLNEIEKSEKEAVLLDNKNIAISALRSSKLKKEQKVNSIQDEDRAIAGSHNEEIKLRQKEQITTMVNRFKSIAGYSIIIALMLVGAQEYLNFKNEIMPSPVLEFSDFTRFSMWEVVEFPFVVAKRYSVNKVRSWNENLPEPKRLKVDPKIFDGSSEEQTIERPEIKLGNPVAPAYNPAATGTSRPLAARGEIVASSPIASPADRKAEALEKQRLEDERLELEKAVKIKADNERKERERLHNEQLKKEEDERLRFEAEKRAKKDAELDAFKNEWRKNERLKKEAAEKQRINDERIKAIEDEQLRQKDERERKEAIEREQKKEDERVRREQLAKDERERKSKVKPVHVHDEQQKKTVHDKKRSSSVNKVLEKTKASIRYAKMNSKKGLLENEHGTPVVEHCSLFKDERKTVHYKLGEVNGFIKKNQNKKTESGNLWAKYWKTKKALFIANK